MSTAATPDARRSPGPSLRVAISLMVVGAALAIPTFIAGIVPVVRAVTNPIRFDAPGQAVVHLGKGTYMVYEDKGASSIGSAFSTDDSVTITPADVTVSGADGTSIQVRDRGTIRETLTRDGDRFVGAVRFTTPASGDYAVTVHDTTARPVLIARPLSNIVGSVLGWFALTGVGGLAFGVGVVLLIVGSVRRSRMRNAFAYATLPPAGWYPDPGDAGRSRYWDGYRWTEHVQ
ncbi:MAG TPA: DUF2510 domain-containing protein [Acidimicrobiia bacterium]